MSAPEQRLPDHQAEFVNKLADQVLDLGVPLNEVIDLLNLASYGQGDRHLTRARQKAQGVVRDLTLLIQQMDPEVVKAQLPTKRRPRRKNPDLDADVGAEPTTYSINVPEAP